MQRNLQQQDTLTQNRTLAGSLYITGDKVEGLIVGDCIGVVVGTKSAL